MARGQFSLVVALYNVAEYVPAFLESLRTQTYPVQDLDIVVVDDGSTDTSAVLVERWRREHHPGLRLIRQENAGPAAARNTGLRLAGNTWVTFCDPDDVFHPAYFQEVDKFLQGDANRSAQLLATRLVQFTDGTTKMNHHHPLGKKFRFGNTLVSLNNNPEFIQLHGPTAFLRREILVQHGLTFDERIRPKFEDSHLIGRYLAAVEEPVLGIVASARYLYRRNRQHGASLVAAAWADPRAYDELPRYGYLGMLQSVQGQLGRIPHWAQYMVLYDLIWFYIDDKRMHSVTAGATSLQQECMHGLLEEIVELIDIEVIDAFSIVSQGWIFHNILRRHYKQILDDPPVIQEGKHDEQRGSIRYSYLFQGDHPEEKIYLDGAPVVPIAVKVREHRVLGKTLIKERVLILPEGPGLEIHLDGVPAGITTDRGVPFQPGRLPDQLPAFQLVPPAVPGGPANFPARYVRPLTNRAAKFRQNRVLHRSLTGMGGLAEARDSGTRYVQRIISRGKALRQEAADRRLVSRAGQEPAAARYKDAWLLMDRIGRADDNAEHLYRYLLRERPEINAWFLLERTSRDWDRLAAEGYKLVAYGSDESVLLYLNAVFKISSHLNANIEFPVSKRRFGTGRARFVFLQHGVIKDDMSLWLNTKETALMITATHAEHESIAGDGPYALTPHEVKLVGFPRHDALLKSAELNPVHLRRQILMAPTWREYLRDELETARSSEERAELFERSDFGRNWLQLLRSQALAEFCQRNGYEVVFLPHPELESMVPLLKLPAYVRAAAYSEISVQAQLVQARMMVTDHSSLAFDAAYAGAKIIYFHFDGDEIFGGGHVYRKGYFDYRRDGLGPIAEESGQVVRELAARNDMLGTTLYDERVRSTFPYWDSLSSLRTTSAIENLNGTGPAGAEGTGRP